MPDTLKTAGGAGASVGERCFTTGGKYRGQPHVGRRVATSEGGEFYRRWVESGGRLNDMGGPAYFHEFPPYPGWQDDYVWGTTTSERTTRTHNLPAVNS